MSGRVVHFEVPYDDGDRARRFYGDVFGWQIRSMPEMQYDMVSTGPVSDQGMPSEPGYVGGGMTQRGDIVSRPVITIQVDDVNDTLARVRSSGGSAVGEPIPVGDMGVAAYFQDSEGNLMGLWQNAG
jgi:predicted enzyme related to lactoylglutathione lyase